MVGGVGVGAAVACAVERIGMVVEAVVGIVVGGFAEGVVALGDYVGNTWLQLQHLQGTL